MKHLVLVLALVLMCAVTVYAEETGQAIYTSPNGSAQGLADWLNSQDYINHTHPVADIEKQKYGLGGGLDLVVYEGPEDKQGIAKVLPDEVTVESKYDMVNNQGSTFVVAKYNLWEMVTKKK